LFLSLSIGLTACGSDVVKQQADVGGGGPGGSSSVGGQSVGGQSVGGNGGCGACDAGGSGGSADCASYLDEPSPGTTEIVVTNNRAVSIYLGNGYCIPRYEIKSDGTYKATDLGGSLTCETVEKVEGYPLDCDDDTVDEIAPGTSKSFTWSGRLYEETTMPVACAADPQNPFVNFCYLGTAAAPGPLDVMVHLFETATCDEFFCHQASGQFAATASFDYPAAQVAVSVDP
jgi:hypothetical protein